VLLGHPAGPLVGNADDRRPAGSEQLAGEGPRPVEVLEDLEAEDEVEALVRVEVVEVRDYGFDAPAPRNLVDVERDPAVEPVECRKDGGVVRADVQGGAPGRRVRAREAGDLAVVAEAQYERPRVKRSASRRRPTAQDPASGSGRARRGRLE
jgi:hypothetical protein